MNGATDETKPGSTSSEQHRIHHPVMPKSATQQSPPPGDPPSISQHHQMDNEHLQREAAEKQQSMS
jgi:hypothetical protein